MTLLGEKKQSRARRFVRRLKAYAVLSALISSLSVIPSWVMLLSQKTKEELFLVWQGIGSIVRQAPLDLISYFLDVLSPVVITSLLIGSVSLALMTAIDLSQERKRYERRVREGTNLVTPEQFMRLFDTDGLTVSYSVEERTYHRAYGALGALLLIIIPLFL